MNSGRWAWLSLTTEPPPWPMISFLDVYWCLCSTPPPGLASKSLCSRGQLILLASHLPRAGITSVLRVPVRVAINSNTLHVCLANTPSAELQLRPTPASTSLRLRANLELSAALPAWLPVFWDPGALHHAPLANGAECFTVREDAPRERD